MKKVRILFILFFVSTFIISCGGNSSIEEDEVEAEVLDSELKGGIKFSLDQINKPSNFTDPTIGTQFLTVETLVRAQTPFLVVNEMGTVKKLSAFDDKLIYNKSIDNTCFLPTENFTMRYQWEYQGFTYTSELGQNNEFNFWATEYNVTEADRIHTVLITGSEKRGDEIEGCLFVSTDSESNLNIKWIKDANNTYRISYTVYDDGAEETVTLEIKADGSGSSISEQGTYIWTADGTVSFVN